MNIAIRLDGRWPEKVYNVYREKSISKKRRCRNMGFVELDDEESPKSDQNVLNKG